MAKSTDQQEQVTSSKTRSAASRLQTNNSALNNNSNQQQNLHPKKEMQSCNQRLKDFMDRQQEYESEINQLQNQIHIQKEAFEKKLKERNQLYENQLIELRSQLDLECTNSAKKDIEHDRLTRELLENEKEKEVLINDLTKFEKRANILSNDLNKQKDKINYLTEQNEQLIRQIKDLEIQINQTDKMSKKNLSLAETEKLRSISLENKIKSLEDQLSTQSQLHEQELEEIKAKYDEELQLAVDEEVDREIESFKTELMINSQREKEEEICKIKQDLEKKYANLINQLKEDNAKAISNEKLLKNKVNSQLSFIEKLNQNLSKANRIETELRSKIVELEGLLEIEANEKLHLIEQKNREINDLKEELKTKESANQLVLDSNLQLTDEIRIYKSLLDENDRRSINSDSESPSKQLRANTPRRYAQPIRKRKRISDQVVNETTISNNASGSVVIDESNDQFIRLFNKGDEEVSLHNWTLNRQSIENEDDGYTFKFGKTIVLQPKASVTVYSLNAENAEHNTPVAIKLKRDWPIGDTCITSLFNQKGEEMARWELKFQSKRTRYNANSSANNSCSLM